EAAYRVGGVLRPGAGADPGHRGGVRVGQVDDCAGRHGTAGRPRRQSVRLGAGVRRPARAAAAHRREPAGAAPGARGCDRLRVPGPAHLAEPAADAGAADHRIARGAPGNDETYGTYACAGTTLRRRDPGPGDAAGRLPAPAL